jgi:23S rRNA pseudouridine2605 synthase
MVDDMTDRGERIAKVIARAGLCSRRDAERLIAEGRVTVAGKVLDSPAVTVLPGEEIAVDGAALPAAAPARLWRYHKPGGLITAARDPQDRPTIYDRLPQNLPRVMPVGRLDLNSEGLLLLTNDGGLKRRLELPATGWTRRYRVRVFGRIDEERLAALAKGVRVDGLDYGPIRARLDSRRGANAWLSMALAEGKNREVRKVCEHLGLKVSRLIRVAYGPFQLGQLPVGAVEEVPAKVLDEQLGDKPRKPRTGFAKAKPKPRKPGHRKAGQRKTDYAHRRRQA